MSSIFDRRVFFKVAATGVTGCMISPAELFPQGSVTPPANILGTAKYCIFILLAGGPSQIDTFDLKVGPWTPASLGPSTVNGVDWPMGLLPTLGDQLSRNRLSVIRSCQAPALVHSLQVNWAQIARSPSSGTGRIAPNVGSIVALEKERERQPNQPIPGFLSINGGYPVVGSGYLGGSYSPFNIFPSSNGLRDLAHPEGEARFKARYNMLSLADENLRRNSPVSAKFEEMGDFYAAAGAMMYNTAVTNAFMSTSAESARYGGGFGSACLTARNVLQANLGVRYIQINLGGWDHHTNLYSTGMYNLAGALDRGLGNLISDLAEAPGSRGTFLDDTLIIARGEFGRTVGPLTPGGGRDHYYPYSTLIAGGGVRGGRVLGSTTASGAFVDDPGWSQGRPIYTEDFAATIYSALGINYRTIRNDDPLGRGFEYVPTTGTNYIGEPIAELFT
jgi:hypothetical protein